MFSWLTNNKRDRHKAVQTPSAPSGPEDWLQPTPVWNGIPHHNTMRGGPQARQAGVPAVVQGNYNLERTVVMPRDPHAFTLDQALNHRVQVEQSSGDLRDYAYLPAPPLVQHAVNYQAPVYPLEMIRYRNAGIDEGDYWALAQARVAAALGKR